MKNNSEERGYPVEFGSRTDAISKFFSRELSEVNKRNRGPIRILLLTHRQADPDALCSAAGLSLLLGKMTEGKSIEAQIIAPLGASQLGTKVYKTFSIEFTENVSLSEVQVADFIIALDLGEIELLGPYAEAVAMSRAKRVLIDHHATTARASTIGAAEGERDLPPFDKVFIDQKACSTCEIITNGFPSSFFDKECSAILLVGLLFDSQHLGLATASTLEAALTLVKAGAEIEESKSVLRSRPDRSEIIARVKSAQRLRSEEAGEYVLLQTEVSSFHASVARMLVEIGGDLGMAYGENNGETRISVRSTQRFYRETGIDLGEVLSDYAESKKSSSTNGKKTIGGGHSTAASLSGDGAQPKAVADEVFAIIKRKIPQ